MSLLYPRRPDGTRSFQESSLAGPAPADRGAWAKGVPRRCTDNARGLPTGAPVARPSRIPGLRAGPLLESRDQTRDATILEWTGLPGDAEERGFPARRDQSAQ